MEFGGDVARAVKDSHEFNAAGHFSVKENKWPDYEASQSYRKVIPLCAHSGGFGKHE